MGGYKSILQDPNCTKGAKQKGQSRHNQKKKSSEKIKKLKQPMLL